MRVMQMTVMQIVGMPVVLDSRMTASGAVLVFVVVMFLTRFHRCSSRQIRKGVRGCRPRRLTPEGAMTHHASAYHISNDDNIETWGASLHFQDTNRELLHSISLDEVGFMSHECLQHRPFFPGNDGPHLVIHANLTRHPWRKRTPSDVPDQLPPDQDEKVNRDGQRLPGVEKRRATFRLALA